MADYTLYDADRRTVLGEFSHEELDRIVREVAYEMPGEVMGLAALVLKARAERDLAICEVGNIGAKLGRMETERDAALARVREVQSALCPHPHPDDCAYKRFYEILQATPADDEGYVESMAIIDSLRVRLDKALAENAELCKALQIAGHCGLTSPRAVENERLRMAFEKDGLCYGNVLNGQTCAGMETRYWCKCCRFKAAMRET